jgi:TPR repeat protein
MLAGKEPIATIAVRDLAVAKKFYVGCDHADRYACAELSQAYQKGLGVKRDAARAKALMRKAEELGYRGE